MNKLTGSSLDRKVKEIPDYLEKDPMEKLLEKPLKIDEYDESIYELRSMSPRTKAKIRKKVIAFGRQSKKLSFVTLTFLNKVTDRQAIKVLGAFLDNVSKRSKDFQYLWVAEKQSKNEVFKDNIHFHLITNKFWNITRWWTYWLEVQKTQGIVPRDENYKPSSAFDVKVVSSNNIKGVGNYITKYITKNTGQYRCMVWNCSRKISQLYTDFYSDMIFLTQLEKLEQADQLGGKIQTYKQEYCSVHLIPLNNITSRLYNKIDEQNKIVWKMIPKEKIKGDKI
ncbi:MAG: hypothetical protein Q8891_16270 [Bacteroidota bacterium]|nr:hypothetical protein [Bacteroidota bacterium]